MRRKVERTGATMEMTSSYLERLVINVSHDCNLRCTYCYADTGSYGAHRAMLSESLGENIIDEFFQRFDTIGNIQFFGGEPLLNPKAIKTLCAYVTRLCEERSIERPSFTLVTNGTLLNEAIIDTVNTHNIRMTVSLDGYETLNDSQRVYSNGSGSFRRIVDNIKIFKEQTGQPFQIEGTFTSKHLHADFSVTEFMRFVAQELDVHFLHMPWILGSSYGGAGILPNKQNVTAVVAAYEGAISTSFQSLTTADMSETILISSVERFLGRPHRAERTCPRHYCPAGSGTLSVGIDGKIYPCFMFTNKPAFELGQIGVTNHKEVERRAAGFAKQLELPETGTGNGAEIGSYCAGINFEASGRIDRVSAAEKMVFDSLATHIDNEVVRLKKDRNIWEWIQTKYLLHRLEV